MAEKKLCTTYRCERVSCPENNPTHLPPPPRPFLKIMVCPLSVVLGQSLLSKFLSLTAVRNGFTLLKMVFNIAGLKLKKAKSFLVSFIANRGLLALSAGSFDEAHRHFVAATKLDPYNSVVRHNTRFCVFCDSLFQSEYQLFFHIN